MELSYRREVSVGLLVIVAVAIFVFGFMWLRGEALARPEILAEVRFERAAGLKKGDPVQVSGVSVGKVERVDLLGLDDVRVVLDVPRRWQPRVDAWARVIAVGFVGDHAVEYWPGTSREFLPDTSLVEGRSDAGIAEIAGRLTARADTLMEGAQAILSRRIADDVRSTLLATQEAMRTVAALGAGPATRQAVSTLARLEQAAARLDSTLGNPGLVQALNNMDEFSQSLTEMMQGLAGATVALQGILARVDAGEGTIGQMTTDSLLYNDLRRLTNALADLLVDLRERPGRYLTVKLF